ncbi:hypothetical protein Ancab_035497 [Ancistrocladus abbreviatus]
MAYIQCGRNILRNIVQDGSLEKFDGLAHPLLHAGHGICFRKLESIDKPGKAGETLKVASGYFRNYLMPKLLAVPNIEKFAYLVREQRKIYEPKEVEDVKVVKDSGEDMVKEYIAATKHLDNAKLVDNELRTPVTKDELVSEVARQLGVVIQPENLHLLTTLSSLGEYELPLHLPKSIPLPEGKIMWTLNVKIRRRWTPS